MTYFASTSTINYMELDYDENNHNRNDHPLKPFKIFSGN